MNKAAERDEQLAIAIVAIFATFLLHGFGTSGRAVSSGSDAVFISLTGDIVPVIVYCWSGLTARRIIYDSKRGERILAVFVLGLSMVSMILVVFSWALFWFGPYSRGSLIGI